MKFSGRSERIALLIVLIAATAGICVHYDVSYDAYPSYTSGRALLADYDAHIGERTFLFGTVQSVAGERDGIRIRVRTERGPLNLTVQETERSVQPGGLIQVFGTVEPDRTVDAMNVVVVNPTSSSELYKYAVSGVGAILVLAQFFRHWQFDVDALGFEVRGRG